MAASSSPPFLHLPYQQQRQKHVFRTFSAELNPNLSITMNPLTFRPKATNDAQAVAEKTLPETRCKWGSDLWNPDSFAYAPVINADGHPIFNGRDYRRYWFYLLDDDDVTLFDFEDDTEGVCIAAKLTSTGDPPPTTTPAWRMVFVLFSQKQRGMLWFFTEASEEHRNELLVSPAAYEFAEAITASFNRHVRDLNLEAAFALGEVLAARSGLHRCTFHGMGCQYEYAGFYSREWYIVCPADRLEVKM